MFSCEICEIFKNTFFTCFSTLFFMINFLFEKCGWKAFASEMCHLHNWNSANGDYDTWELGNEYFVSRFLWMKIQFVKNGLKKIHAKNKSVEEEWIIFRDFTLFRRKKCIYNKLLCALESALFFNYRFTQTFLFRCFSWGFLLFLLKDSYKKIKITPCFSFSFISVF